MADTYTYSPMGQSNGSGSTSALWLKVFAGEVLTAFKRKTIMDDKHMTQTISGAKEAQFPVTGRAGDGKYHLPGTELTGTVQKQAERTISLDRPLVADLFTDNWEEKVTHFPLRSIYSTNLGEELAQTYDQHVLIKLILAARANAVVTGLDGGTQITSDLFKIATGGASDNAEKAAALASAIYQAAEELDDNEAPEDGRFCILRPSEYYCLVQAVQDSGFSVVNSDYKGAGSYADGTVTKIAGITILKHSRLPSADTSAAVGGGDATDKNYYHGVDASKTIGMVFTKDAVGTVKLMDIGVESDYQVERQGTLVVAKYAVGHGILRPECAVELKLSSLSN